MSCLPVVDPVIPLLGIYPEEVRSTKIDSDNEIAIVIASVYTHPLFAGTQ